MSANIRRQTAGVLARFLPPGHSSRVKIIGQFSMPIFTPLSSAYCTSGFQTSRKRGQFSSIERAGSRPTKVVKTFTPSAAEASMTFRQWAISRSACSRSAWRTFG